MQFESLRVKSVSWVMGNSEKRKKRSQRGFGRPSKKARRALATKSPQSVPQANQQRNDSTPEEIEPTVLPSLFDETEHNVPDLNLAVLPGNYDDEYG